MTQRPDDPYAPRGKDPYASPQGAGPENLQFETADFSAAPAAAQAGPGGAQPAPAAQTSAACGQGIADAYYLAGDKVFCPRCHDAMLAHLARPPGSRVGRFSKALLLGLLASVVAAFVWFGIRKMTGSEFGIVAIGVGLLIGVAVRKGSGGRGGWKYQTLAILLTYACICSTYMPEIASELIKHFEEDKAAAQPATIPAAKTTTRRSVAAGATKPATTPAGDSAAKSSHKSLKGIGIGKAILLSLVLVAILFILSLVMPVLAGFKSPMWLIIIGIALWEAWKINKRAVIPFTGPYSAGGGQGARAFPPNLPA
jgi:hypothetical protein